VESFSAVENPAKANELIKQMMEEQVTVVGVPETYTPAPLPPDSSVELAAGFMDFSTGEVYMDAEVRELNGVDEEAVARVTDSGKSLLTILQRGVVSVGDKKATVEILDQLLAGDRELLLVAIRKATFGNEVKLEGSCPECLAPGQVFTIDLEEDLTVKRLDDPSDRNFIVETKSGPVLVSLPTGRTQKKLLQNSDKTLPELDTLLLRDCISEINGLPVMDVKQVQALGIADRRKITSEIADRAPGPRLGDIKKMCSACEQEVPIPLTVADLFRL
jgi:uncharacterized protein (DUF952 family)